MHLFPVELSRFLNVFLLQLSFQGWGAFHFSLLLEQVFAKSGVGLKFGTKGNQVAAKSPRATRPDGSLAVLGLAPPAGLAGREPRRTQPQGEMRRPKAEAGSK